MGETHILLKLRKGFADSVLQKSHGLTVGIALHRLLQGLPHRVGEQRRRRGAVDVAGGESGYDGGRVHVDTPEQDVRNKRMRLSHQTFFEHSYLKILNLCAAAGADEWIPTGEVTAKREDDKTLLLITENV